MGSFPSLYRARAVDTADRKITAFVPTVFGEEPITVTEYINGLPNGPGMGWVFFQAGNPEFPVWATVTDWQDSDIGGVLGDIEDLQAADVVLDGRLDIIEAYTRPQMRALDGTVGAPGYAFASDLDTGLWKIADGVIGVSTNGVERARFTATGLSVTGTLGCTGALTVGGTLNVTGVISGDGSGLTNLNASALASGTVPSARVSGSYTGITTVGTLTALTVTGQINANGKIVSGVAAASEAMNFPVAGQYLAWFTGATREGYLQGNAAGMILASETGRLALNGNDGIQLGTAKINGYTMSESAIGSRLVCSTSAGYINSNYFNCTADVTGAASYFAGQNGDNYIRWYTGCAVSGQVQSAKQNNSGAYNDQGIYQNTAGVGAASGWGMHPGGVAGSVRMGINSGQWHMNNVDASGYYPVAATGFNVASHPRFKSNVVDLVIPRPVEVTRQLRPVWFQVPGDLLEPMEVRGDGGTLLETRFYNHDCDTSPFCKGTHDNPCSRKRVFDQGRIGLMADEVQKLFPIISTFGMDGELLGYDLGGLVTLLVAAVQNLTDDLAELREKVA